MVKNTVCIVGLGWLGMSLYRKLDEAGWNVLGTKTSAHSADELNQSGIRAFRLALNPGPQDEKWREWMKADTLVINIPPGRKSPDVESRYPEQVKHLLAMAEKQGIEHVVFVSSTSVFGGASGKVDDDAPLQPDTDSGRALVQCEEMVTNFGGVVVRFGGLYGPDRHPGRFFAGRTGVPHGDAPVNFIHQDDAVGVLKFIIEHYHPGLRINATAPAHPPKKSFYHRAALHFGAVPPQFEPGGADQKEIRCDWLEKQGFVFSRSGLELYW